MHHVEGCDRDQAQLLPARVDDYVHRDNPVRFIDAFVDDLDLNEAGFARVEPKDTGRPAYDPADLLKLYIYGYVNRVRSSRRLETEAGRNLEVIWLLCGLRPDFKTIADFRKDNRNAFKAVRHQRLSHQHFIKIVPAILQRVLPDPVFDKTEASIEATRGLVVADHGQLDQLDVPASVVEDGVDQPACDPGSSGS